MSDHQKTWEDYYSRIRNRRLEEAGHIWDRMEQLGVTSETDIFIDFTHFGNVSEQLQALAEQLSENYDATIGEPDSNGYQTLSCTTKPYETALSRNEFLSWIEFMCDVSQSYGCVFSTWHVECPVLNAVWSNKNEDAGLD